MIAGDARRANFITRMMSEKHVPLVKGRTGSGLNGVLADVRICEPDQEADSIGEQRFRELAETIEDVGWINERPAPDHGDGIEKS